MGTWEDYVRVRDEKIQQAKRVTRTDLKATGGDWSRLGYAKTDILNVDKLVDTIPRIHYTELSEKEFTVKYEAPRVPVVITGLTDEWKAREAWTIEKLNATYADAQFQVGWDNDGEPVRLSMRYFLDYCLDKEHSQDDSPLYIFDSGFVEASSLRLRKDYEVPRYFKEDLLQLVDPMERPPYRWLTMGPARSGTYLHLDPLYTSAWNSLLSGHKRWVFFPPGTPKDLVAPDLGDVELEAVSWFKYVYPRTQQPDWPLAKPLEMIQHPGETLFVPGGWWHAVMNLDLTVAVTQNYANTVNFRRVYGHTRQGRSQMAVHWLEVLRKVRPDLATVAEHINTYGCPDCELDADPEEEDDDADESPDGSEEEKEEEPATVQAPQEKPTKHKRRPYSAYSLSGSKSRNKMNPINPMGQDRRMVKEPSNTLSFLHLGRPISAPQHARQLTDIKHHAGSLNGAVGGVAAENQAYLVAHGGLMAAWLVLFPLAVMLSRHKWVLGDRSLGWVHVFFRAQKLVQVLVLLSMLAGFLIGLVALDAPESQSGKLHFFFGSVIFALAAVQILGIMPSARADTPERQVWERIQRWASRALLLGGGAAAYTGIVLIQEKTGGYHVHAPWLLPACFVAGVLIVLEVLLMRMKGSRGLQDGVKAFAMNGGGYNNGKGQDSKGRLYGLVNDLHFRSIRSGVEVN